MSKPVVKLDGVKIAFEVDPKTNKPVVKHYRIVYTDAVETNASVPDEEALKEVDDRLKQVKDQNIDGFILEPLR
jgi:uridylate kinase